MESSSTARNQHIAAGPYQIHDRVQVFWPDDQEYYHGIIQQYDPVKGWFVQYDDGEEQWEVSLLKFKSSNHQFNLFNFKCTRH